MAKIKKIFIMINIYTLNENIINTLTCITSTYMCIMYAAYQRSLKKHEQSIEPTDPTNS
jgi:hypothetical protein